jgi:hypothetical protein
MGIKVVYDYEDNRCALKKAYKALISQQERICNRCHFHRGENTSRRRKDRRNWKRFRKTQWK